MPRAERETHEAHLPTRWPTLSTIRPFRSELLEYALITLLEHREPGPFRISGRERFRDPGRINRTDYLTDRVPAKGTVLQGRAVDRSSQFKSPGTADTTSIRVVGVFRKILVKWHLGCGWQGDSLPPLFELWKLCYQLDFVTPGISPAEAISRKVMRESLNRRR